ncbi:MAG: HlyD family efflux transporter periplasmic adaptor subunit [Candidatus Latescibacteria bacterium]|nr:HlyD family efflux transporter periplasmic adaptor subunit [Candidatus Latescibacterota bacterium]
MSTAVHRPDLPGGRAQPASPHPPLPDGNGRSAAAHEPLPTEHLNLRLTRCVLAIIIAVVAVLIAGGAALSTCIWMDVTVVGRGTIEPVNRCQAKSALSGIVGEIHVQQWDRVGAGDPLAVLDDSKLRAELEALEKELEVNRSRMAEIETQVAHERDIIRADIRKASMDREAQTIRLDQVRKEYELHYALTPPAEGTPRGSVDDLLPVRLHRAALHRADADVERALRRLAALEAREQEIATLEKLCQKLEADHDHRAERLKHAVIRAPMSGVVLTGDLHLRIGDRLQPGDPLLEIGEPDCWRAKVSVSELDIPKVEAGQAVRMATDAFPYMEYGMLEGTVSGVPAIPSSSAEGGSTYAVKVSVKDPVISNGERTYALSCGMAVEARIVVERGTVLDIAWKRLLRTAGKVVPLDIHLTPN